MQAKMGKLAQISVDSLEEQSPYTYESLCDRPSVCRLAALVKGIFIDL